MTAESLRRGAWASSRLAGARLEVEGFTPPFPDGEDGALAAAALRTTVKVGPLVGVWARAPLQALATLHSVAAAGRVPDDELGRPRPDREVTGRLAQLAEVATAGTTAPALVLAGVVHGELIALQPFTWGSDLVARAAQRLVLAQRGVDPDSLSIPEQGLLELGAQEYTAAGQGYASGELDGVARWLVHVASSVARGAAAGRRVCAGME